LKLVALIPPSLLVVIVVRLLRPVIVIRFGPLVSFRIGHFSSNTETYLSERDSGLHGKRVLDIFYDRKPVCNQQLRRMWGRIIPIYPFIELPDRLNRNIPGGKAHEIPARQYQGRDVHGVLAITEPHLFFTEEEEARGQAGLEELGLGNGAEFICMLGRDSLYLDTTDSARDWHYHDFRDIDIQSYLLAAEELTRRGYHVVRVGSLVKEEFKTSNPMIIDYSNREPNDFMDIYLTANCRFFMSCGTGLDGVANAFRKPVAFVSYVPMDWGYTWNKNHIMIPKMHWLKEENRFMSFREILGSEVAFFRNTDQYKAMGIELQENTPEQIRDVAVEMEERISGDWVKTEKDEEFQTRFRSLYLSSDRHGAHLSRIGSRFIDEFQHLLD